MRKIGLFLCGLIFLFLTSICTGCGHKTETGEREIVLAAARDLVQGEKDPYYATIILKTWEPLVGISDDGHEMPVLAESWDCLLYTSDAADDGESVDLGGRRIIKKIF